MAAMPPAAPHPTSSGRRRVGTRIQWPRLDPIADPICTMGPSRPTDPPVPMHSADASALTTATRGRIRPSWALTASITSGTPCPRASRAHRYTSGP